VAEVEFEAEATELGNSLYRAKEWLRGPEAISTISINGLTSEHKQIFQKSFGDFAGLSQGRKPGPALRSSIASLMCRSRECNNPYRELSASRLLFRPVYSPDVCNVRFQIFFWGIQTMLPGVFKVAVCFVCPPWYRFSRSRLAQDTLRPRPSADYFGVN
jgi:hypothetical protein